jgi:hypothetical protein
MSCPDVPMMGCGTELGVADMVGAGSRRIWVAVGWVAAVAATVLNGVVVGYGAIWIQFFGATADAGDYAVSAGGYGAAAAVLALAVPAILTHRGPRWLVWSTSLSVVVLGLLAARSAEASAHAARRALLVNSAWDGIGCVLWAAWTWALVALGIHGLRQLFARPVREGIRWDHAKRWTSAHRHVDARGQRLHP